MSPRLLFLPASRSAFCVRYRQFRVLVVAMLCACFVQAAVGRASAQTVWISEFMAQNDETIADNFGVYSDWIEIHNSGAAAVNLGGYFLTDDPADLRKWEFPSKELGPGGYLLVFASGADRRSADSPLHTNFKLAADGEYLALVKPDGTVAHHFSPSYPAQRSGVSYGLAVEEKAVSRYVASGSTARVLVPTGDIGSAWTGADFDDSGWSSMTVALKYERVSGGYDAVPGSDVESLMYGKNGSIYMRVPFQGGARLPDLQMVMRYDDGFVAYLNGREIARRFAPNVPGYASVATNQRSNSVVLAGERFDLGEFSQFLNSGLNVLAVQGLNRSSFDADFLLWPEVTARDVLVLTNRMDFFDSPSPGAANAAGLMGTAGTVTFSKPSTTFNAPFELKLETEETSPGAVIRYTLNRTEPTESSPVYDGPVSIRTTVQVRARVFAPDMLPGPVETESYIALSPTVVNFTSDLPIVVIHTMGAGTIGASTERAAYITVHEPVRGRSSLLNAPQLVTQAGLKTRGSSTGGQPKANYAVEFWDDSNRPHNLPILGMPADSDWVFHAPYNFDPALIRNPLAYEMSQRLGRYAPRYRFAEVYVNASTSGGPIASNHYVGVYNIVEKVKRGKNRVDVDELRPSDLQEPEVTGGYLLKIDRTDPGDSGFSAGGRQVAYVDPKEPEIERPERDAQEKYIRGYIGAFASALNNNSTFTHPTRGYAPFIDAGSWIDHQIVDTVTFNVDALRLSSYFRKERNGPLVYGPVWDFDRSLGSTDGRDTNPRTWGSGFFTETWWNRLFRDPNFWQQWIDRWQSLRETTLSDAALLQLIDDLAATVAEAAPRDYAKWRQAKRGGSQEGEILHLKNWLMNRVDFMDSYPLRKPVFSHASGRINPGFALTMVAPPEATVYYTLDGSDPRLPGGQLSPAARIYAGPVSIPSTATIRARARNLSHRHPAGGNNPPLVSPWSGITEAHFSTQPPPAPGTLLITEIQFDPAPPTTAELAVNATFQSGDFEFLELKNSSGQTIDLHGASFTSGIGFSFSGTSAEAMAPGATVLLVKNRDAFAARYGARSNIAGEYRGSLNDGGEELRITSAQGEVMLDARFEGDWYPTTAGHGFSLVRSDSGLVGLSRQKWRPSATAGGSPGEDDPAPMVVPQVMVNEALAWTRDDDALELYNPTSSPAAIGGWFLTDDPAEPKRFRVPAGTIIPAGGYMVFNDDQFNASGAASGFSFNRAGDGVYLFSADAAGNLLWYAHGFEFGASEREVTFGRYMTSTGAQRFVAQTQPTLGSLNAGPRVGPLVVNEIMYRPPDVAVNGGQYDNHEDEYIELHNWSDQPVALFDSANPTNTWRIRSAVQFAFPTNVVVPAKGFLVLTGFDPDASPEVLTRFRTQYGISADVPVFGPWTGKLDNSADTIRLMKPVAPLDAQPGEQPEVPYVLVDTVRYEDNAPWPAGADGLGQSLQRLNSVRYGDDPANWASAAPTPGVANRVTSGLRITSHPQSQNLVAGNSVTFRVAAAGADSLRYQWRFNGQNIPGATNAAYEIPRSVVSSAGDYEAVVLSSTESVVSDSARLTLVSPPQIVLHPQSRSVQPGTNILMAVTVLSSDSVEYQWYYNGTAMPGETGPSLTLTNVQWFTTGNYAVEVRDAIGRTLSNSAELIVLARPVLLEHPESHIAFVGDTVTLGAVAEGTPPLSYRWRRNGTYVADQTNAVLTLRNIQMSDAGNFSVQITNIASGRFGIVSREAVVSVFEDKDGDRLGDSWEVANGFSTNNAADALLDFDGDGISNLVEFMAATDPRDKASFFRIDAVRSSAGAAFIEFMAQPDRAYKVEYSDSIASGDWSTLSVVPAQSVSRTESVPDSRPGTNRFYRVTISIQSGTAP